LFLTKTQMIMSQGSIQSMSRLMDPPHLADRRYHTPFIYEIDC